MELKDLFVSHKQVDPVVFSKPHTELPRPIYLNRHRAQQVASSESNQPSESTDTFDWNADRETDENSPEWNTKSEVVKTESESPETIVSTQTTVPTNTVKTDTQTNDFSNLMRFIEEFEGFRSNVYNDPGGVPTIGYGFTNPEIVNLGTIDKNTARKYLEKEILTRSNKLKSQIKTWDKLNKNQQDALISYAYNVGVENWSKYQPKLLKALNEGRFEDAVKYIDVVKDSKGVEQPGLVRRRKAEQELFMS